VSSGRRLDVVVLGLGTAGASLHLPALRRITGVNLVGAADPDRSLHAAAGGLPVWTDWKAALATGADAVIVATPAETHAELAGAALDQGMHTYLEKPMATSLAEAVALGGLARASGRVVQLGFAYRFHPLWGRVGRLLAEGWLRPPLRATGHFRVAAGGAGWREPLIDVSCHHVDIVSSMLGATPSEVSVEPSTRLVARWPDGSVLDGRYDTGAPVDRVELSDRRRCLVVDRLRGLRLVATGASIGRLGRPIPGLVRARWSGWERSFEAALQAFVVASSGGSADPRVPGPAAGMAMVATAEAVMRSARTGRRQTVEATMPEDG